MNTLVKILEVSEDQFYGNDQLLLRSLKALLNQVYFEAKLA